MRRPALSWPRRGAARGDALAQAEAALTAQAWQRLHRASRRWALWGALAGALLALVLFAPAAWLAQVLASASQQRVLLVQTRGTVWNGSAVLVVGAGADSQDAVLLPGRLHWTLRPAGLQALLSLRQDCCMDQPLQLRLQPGFGRLRATLEPPPGGRIGQWPAAWLSGLGTPWNTLQLGGLLNMSASGLQLEWAQGRLALLGNAQLDVLGMSSRLSTLRPLGSYRLQVQGTGQATTLDLSTLQGALQLSGQGQWAGSRLRFTGEARAAEGSEAALNNLLNIIGRRQGARAVITIG
ncbi:type II secretion system protein N [Azohydromonas aeria]|uniref:type II secretion system protein N n=1 Tax=Azohydromonas aeria TaxID=2590212 RepID=UPI0012F81E07|nr:type II secretion system protein N [Azohydromonas aeria]